MKLKCRIHEKDYDIVSGSTFSEEYNETLDSGSIILDHVAKINDLKPYDDVYIWNSDEDFNGYYNVGDNISINLIKDAQIAFSLTNVEGGSNGWASFGHTTYINETDSSFEFRGTIINVWASKFLGYLNETRWKLSNNNSEDKITFKFNLSSLTNNLIQNIDGYYKISLSKEDGVYKGTNYLIFEKDRNYNQNSGLPPYLYIKFSANIPIADYDSFDNYSAENPALILDKRAVEIRASSSAPLSSIDNGFDIIGGEEEGRVYSINSVSIQEGDYYKNALTTTQIFMSVNGLSQAQILLLRGIKINALVNNQLIELESKIIVQNGSNILMQFQNKDYSITNPFASFSIELQKNDEKNWSGITDFKINLKKVDYYADNIINDLNSEVYIRINDSNQQVLPRFFKHLLVDSFTCEMVDLDKENYKYKIDLMSETKRLEKVVLPNISITQPIVGQKRTIWYYLNQYINLYSPKVKFVDKNNKWVYKNKFKIDPRSTTGNFNDEYLKTPLHEIFDDTIYAPELSLTAPTLREILSRLMIVKDCIPVVRNDVIYAMKISDTHGIFKTDSNHFSFITESMNSSNYSTSFRREYGGAISQKNSTHMIEYLGFRNKNNALLTLDNMQLETRFPIYKINKLYMCYYKTITVNKGEENYDKLILVKQDISKLVLQNTVRDTLAADWTGLDKIGSDEHGADTTEMSKHRLLTLGYEIGSNVITGWGEKYSYISDALGWASETHTYIETIMNALDKKYPFGENGTLFLEKDEYIPANATTDWKQKMVTNDNDKSLADLSIANKLKSLFFQMDYIGMYSGAVVYSKENISDDSIQTSDNCSSALSILEIDGLFEREKSNRLGNNEFGFIGRFSNVFEMNETYNDIIGAKWEKDEDVIIYHKEYQIYDDCVLCNFLGTKDYVMKNYFTTVFAKYRTYSYASYTDSVNRNENDKYLITLSENKCLYENDISDTRLLNVTSIISGFSETNLNDDLTIDYPDQINGGFFSFKDENGEIKSYLSDVNQFVAGYSLCFNIRTYDSIINGNYISTLNYLEEPNTDRKKYVGSMQTWYEMPVKDNDGFLETIGCYFGHFNDESIIFHNVLWSEVQGTDLYSKLFKLPLNSREPTFRFGKEYNFCKDDKEIINYTLQYELINNDNNLLVSEWLMKLTDFNNYTKFSTKKEIIDSNTYSNNFYVYFGSKYVGFNFGYLLALNNYGNVYKQQIRIKVKKDIADEDFKAGRNFIDCKSKRSYSSSFGSGNSLITYDVSIKLLKIEEVIKDDFGNINILKIRANFSRTTYITDRLVFVESKNSSVILTFYTTRTLIDSEWWYIFDYEGQDCPYGDASIRETLNNHVSIDEAPEQLTNIITGINKTITFPQTMYIVTSNKRMEKSLVYSQYKIDPKKGVADSLKNIMTIIDSDNVNFEDIFRLTIDDQHRPYINFHAKKNILGNDCKSVQYWYYDANGDGYLHFVFGINAAEDKNIENKKIYISLVKDRNEKVYNDLHRFIGNVMNFAVEENKDKYGTQLFELKGE